MTWAPAPPRLLALFASAVRTIAGSPYTGDAIETKGRRGITVFLDVTANVGVFTLDVKLQELDQATSTWIDIPGAAFAQKSGTGHDSLHIYPGIAETANRSVSDILPAQIRAHATLGGAGTSATFSVNAELLA